MRNLNINTRFFCKTLNRAYLKQQHDYVRKAKTLRLEVPRQVAPIHAAELRNRNTIYYSSFSTKTTLDTSYPLSCVKNNF